MNYIFFDVDGVLNGTDKQANWEDDDISLSKVTDCSAQSKDRQVPSSISIT